MSKNSYFFWLGISLQKMAKIYINKAIEER